MLKKRKPIKEKKVVEEVINKCSFCKTNDAPNKHNNFYYCYNNDCSTKLYKELKIYP